MLMLARLSWGRCLGVTALLVQLSLPACTGKTILHIVADDLGYNDLSCRNGNKTSSPHIDSLVRDGISLRDHYAYLICAPTRASLMTGRYPWVVGYYDMNNDTLHCAADYTMLPSLLKQAGYATHALGKWDVGFLGSNVRCGDVWVGVSVGTLLRKCDG